MDDVSRIKLPRSKKVWELETQQLGIGNKTIHDLSLPSASKLKYEHYLLLRVLWTAKKSPRFVAKDFGLEDELEEAREILKQYPDWAQYYKSFDRNIGEDESFPHLGTFSLVRYQQRQIEKVQDKDPETEPNVTVSPTPSPRRTRGRMKRAEIPSLDQRMQNIQLENPAEGASKYQGTPEILDFPGSDSEESNDIVLFSYSPAAKEAESTLYPRAKDEQIVNAALLQYMNALTIHFPFFNDWTLHRRAFSAQFKASSLKARTDGYLEDRSSSKVRAIVEVKPYIRSIGGQAVRMQEAAQMVGWISDDKQRPKRSPGRHLLVSQDRHEIYLTFAEYKEEYLKYLKGELADDDPAPFLRMREFGPWDIKERKHMKQLGEIILAFTIRADKDRKEEESQSASQGKAM